MAIDPEFVSIKTASEMPTETPKNEDFFFYYSGNVLKKAPMSEINAIAKSGIKGEATQTNAPTAYTPEAYPNGLFETYVVRTPLTLPNSWGSAVTQAELDANYIFFDVKNGVVTKAPSKKPVADPAKLPLYSAIKSTNIVAGTQFIDDENGNIQYRVKTGQTLLTTELPASLVGVKVEQLNVIIPRPSYLEKTLATTPAILQSLNFIRSIRILNNKDSATWYLKGYGFSGSNMLFILRKSTNATDYVNITVPYSASDANWKETSKVLADGETIKIVYNDSLAGALINNKTYYLNNDVVVNDSNNIEVKSIVNENTTLIKADNFLSVGNYVDTSAIDVANLIVAKSIFPALVEIRIKNRFANQKYNLKGFGFSGSTFYLIIIVDGVAGDYLNYSTKTAVNNTDTFLKEFAIPMKNGETLTVVLKQSAIGVLQNNKKIPFNESVYIDKLTRAKEYTDLQISNVTALIGSGNSLDSKFMHISFDDVNVCLMDLITNSATYTSIYQNTFFNTLKTLNNTYGCVFSLFCFNQNTVTGFDISNVPNKFKAEFKANSKWLKFGFHGKTETGHINDLTVAETRIEYDKFLTAIYFFADGFNSLDVVPRLSNFVGDDAHIKELIAGNGSLRGLLGSESSTTWAYYLGATNTAVLMTRNKYYDATNQLTFFKSHVRLEAMASGGPLLTTELESRAYAGNMNELIMFTHEGNASGLGKLDSIADWASLNGYKFDFPQNRIK